jgi:pilus assembly protein CpaE
MFQTAGKKVDRRPTVTIVTAEAAIEKRMRDALEASGQHTVQWRQQSITAAAAGLVRNPAPGPIVVAIDHCSQADLAALENLMTTARPAPRVVVVSDGVSEAAARRFLRLQITDWLPHDASAHEIAQAINHALEPVRAAGGGGRQARCIAFMSAVGGAGSTTLCLAAVPTLAKSARLALSSICVVDLEFQAGSVCEYLDVVPNLQLAEIAAAPDRLDDHLLDVMLTRHASGFSVLAAPPSIGAACGTRADVVGRLLDHAAAKFEVVLIDMPRTWLPWSETVVRGLDELRIVTELTVVGLRQARRLADALATACQIDLARSVIVNKCPWLQSSGVRKTLANEVLGERLAGFVGNGKQVVCEAQNKGIMLSEMRKAGHIHSDLAQILAKTTAFRAPQVILPAAQVAL